MATKQQEAVNAWSEILGEHGAMCMYAFNAIRLVPPEVFVDAIGRIDHAESLGSIVDPSAWTGARFNSAQEWKTVLERMHKLATCFGEKVPG